jgi:exodeoxyribonuclease VII large subunit
MVVPELAGMIELAQEYRLRLGRGLRHTSEIWKERLQTLQSRLLAQGPLNQLRREQQRLDYLLEGLQGRMKHRLASSRDHANALGQQLNALSPLAVLQRGYSITKDEQGRVVKRASDVLPGTTLRTKLADGELTSKVV